MYRKCSSLVLAFLAGISTSLIVTACGDKDVPCAECGGIGGGAVNCFTGTWAVICAPDQDLAAITCSEYGGTWAPLTVCEAEAPAETGSDPGSAPFNPGRDINLDPSTGEFVLDRVAFEELKLDPSPLSGDATELQPHELGHELVASGELSAALGWRVGDVLIDLDGHPLRDLAEFTIAYTALAANSEFELTIRRGRSDVVLRYRVE